MDTFGPLNITTALTIFSIPYSSNGTTWYGYAIFSNKTSVIWHPTLKLPMSIKLSMTQLKTVIACNVLYSTSHQTQTSTKFSVHWKTAAHLK